MDDLIPTPATPRGLVMPRALFTADEVADALAVSETLVRQLTLNGDIPCRRIGRLVRYTIEDITAFVDSIDERTYAASTATRLSGSRVHKSA
jgi:excisionase family DNA binding protein